MSDIIQSGGEFTTVRAERVSRQVVEQFRARVRAGDLRPGDKLPPERDLAGQFGVGRNSIREALRELDLLGLVESRHGEGTFVASPSAETLVAPFRAVIELSDSAAESVLEFRRAFEPGICALAATNIDSDGRTLLHTALREFESRVESGGDAAMRADADFHLMIGHVTGNPTVISVHCGLYALLKDFRGSLARSSYDPEGEIAAGHRRIYEAIIAGDAEVAATQMREHLAHVSKAITVRRG